MWSGELQLLQRSPPESEARSQWPRAAHSGLMHCTVQPGKYCTLFPPCEVLRALSACGEQLRQPLRSPDRKSEKVAGILRRCSCGVKRKDTIPSGTVAARPTRDSSPLGISRQGARIWRSGLPAPTFRPARCNSSCDLKVAPPKAHLKFVDRRRALAFLSPLYNPYGLAHNLWFRWA